MREFVPTVTISLAEYARMCEIVAEWEDDADARFERRRVAEIARKEAITDAVVADLRSLAEDPEPKRQHPPVVVPTGSRKP